MLKAPVSLVRTFQTVPRSVSLASTLAPLMGAPLGSRTEPTTAAVTSWLHAGLVRLTAPNNSEKARAILNDLCIAKPPRELFLWLRSERKNIVDQCYRARRWQSSSKKNTIDKKMHFPSAAHRETRNCARHRGRNLYEPR